MRLGAPSDVLATSCSYVTKISSWRGATLLAEDIPLESGRATWRAAADIQSTITIDVPRIVDGFDWLPSETDYLHPLAKMGQELVVTTVITSALTGIEYETTLGRYQIQEVQEASDGLVRVEASDRSQRIADDKFPTLQVPRADGTFFSEFRRLLPAGISAFIDPALTDRAIPQSLAWSEDRLAALQSVADALPARLRINSAGEVALLAPLPEVPVPVITLSEGELLPWNPYPVVMGKTVRQTREGGFNSWVVRGTVTDDPTRPDVQAYADQTTGPFAVDPMGYGTKRGTFYSPLLTTAAQCLAAAQTKLANGLRYAATIPVTLPPDPRLELDDAVRLLTDLVGEEFTGDRAGYITGIDLPLTINDGAMRIDVSVGAI